MTNPPPPTCPECGAAWRKTGVIYKCGTIAAFTDGEGKNSFPQEQSGDCRIASLTRQLSERDARIERLEGAIKSIKRVNLCDGFTADTKKHLIMALVKILDEFKPKERKSVPVLPHPRKKGGPVMAKKPPKKPKGGKGC